jgi:regulatory protein
MQRPALEAALKLLAARSRTEAELRKALISRAYPSTEVETVVARVRELGYLDDSEVARSRARSLLGRGAAPRLAVGRLEAQGIAPAEARSAVDGEAGKEGESGLLDRALERRVKGRKLNQTEKQRVFRSLVQKGFRASAVAKKLGLDWDTDDDHER